MMTQRELDEMYQAHKMKNEVEAFQASLKNAREKRKKAKKRARILQWVIVGAVVWTVSFTACVSFFNNIERVNPHLRYYLLQGVNENDPEALEIYNDYIERDIYLFNGKRTITLMAEKHNLNADELWTEFENSGYEEAQEFFNKVVKKRV